MTKQILPGHQIISLFRRSFDEIRTHLATAGQLLDGMQRLINEQSKPILRRALMEAMEAGDRALADTLQGEILASHQITKDVNLAAEPERKEGPGWLAKPPHPAQDAPTQP